MHIADVMPGEDLQWCIPCREWKENHVDNTCDGCFSPLLPGESTYKSQSYHLHPAAIGGVSGVRAVHKNLCVECYRKDHKFVYPNQPVPELPDRPQQPVALPPMEQQLPTPSLHASLVTK